MGTLTKNLGRVAPLLCLALGLSVMQGSASAQQASGQPQQPEITRSAVATFDQFLDSHPQIAQQLQADPGLVNDRDYVQHHKELRSFLQKHPEVAEELRGSASNFMRRENRFDSREGRNNPNPDLTRGELANMDRFMDSHPETAEQLRKNPSLINNKEFVEGHPALQQFLTQHPGVREEIKENPNAFMRQEQRFDRHEDYGTRRDRDVTRGELASFNGFLRGHGNIASQLAKDPSLATNQEYLENHPELRSYLQANPGVHQGLRENPQSFVKAAHQFETTPRASTGEPKTGEPKTK